MEAHCIVGQGYCVYVMCFSCVSYGKNTENWYTLHNKHTANLTNIVQAVCHSDQRLCSKYYHTVLTVPAVYTVVCILFSKSIKYQHELQNVQFTIHFYTKQKFYDNHWCFSIAYIPYIAYTNFELALILRFYFYF